MNRPRRAALHRGILHALPLSVILWGGLAGAVYAVTRVILTITNQFTP